MRGKRLQFTIRLGMAVVLVAALLLAAGSRWAEWRRRQARYQAAVANLRLGIEINHVGQDEVKSQIASTRRAPGASAERAALEEGLVEMRREEQELRRTLAELKP